MDKKLEIWPHLSRMPTDWALFPSTYRVLGFGLSGSWSTRTTPRFGPEMVALQVIGSERRGGEVAAAGRDWAGMGRRIKARIIEGGRIDAGLPVAREEIMLHTPAGPPGNNNITCRRMGHGKHTR